MAPVRVTHYSDLLCVWAYSGHERLYELARNFGEDVEIEQRFCSVFPDPHAKIADKWGGKDDPEGFAAFARHLLEVSAKFPHAPVSDRVWIDARPITSATPHLFVKAAEMVAETNGEGARAYAERTGVRAAWALREAFFAQTRDICDAHVLAGAASGLGLEPRAVAETMASAEALRRLAADYARAHKDKVEGSPTIVMNDGRQTLAGNVGYRVIEANVKELLRRPSPGEMSWC